MTSPKPLKKYTNTLAEEALHDIAAICRMKEIEEYSQNQAEESLFDLDELDIISGLKGQNHVY